MIKRLFLNDRIILTLILLNAAIIFLSGFNYFHHFLTVFNITDHIITGLFVIEVYVKLREFGAKNYFSSNWNRFDFFIIVLSLPSFISFVFNINTADISFLLIFRIMRIFKSIRFLKFIPGIENLILGIKRALKASIIVLIGFALYIFIIGNFSYFLFGSIAPKYFENPLSSLYSIFKIFTLENWYEIPETITQGFSYSASFFTYFYFIFILITGGIFGLSLVNSIFVDAMVSDNNDELEKKIDNLEKKISELIEQNNNKTD